jgi:hypothetical protein
MSIAPTRESAAQPTDEPVEVLIREARRRGRRHHLGWVVGIAVAGIAAWMIVGAMVGSPPLGPRPPASGDSRGSFSGAASAKNTTKVTASQLSTVVYVIARIPTSECAFETGPGVHVDSAFVITSAELRQPSFAGNGPLERQAPGSKWKLCYVTGHNLAPAFGGPSLADMNRGLPSSPTRPHLNKAIYVFYRGGSIAEVIGGGGPTFKFIAREGSQPAQAFPWLRLANRRF